MNLFRNEATPPNGGIDGTSSSTRSSDLPGEEVDAPEEPGTGTGRRRGDADGDGFVPIGFDERGGGGGGGLFTPALRSDEEDAVRN